MKISVIVPVYNVEKYIERCLQSLMCQTHRDIEVILVDDGSTDSSLQKCREYEGKDQRFRTFHKENGGLSSARNKGLEEATGEYICFVDSDDWVHERFCELLLHGCETTGADMAMCQFQKTSTDIQQEELNVAKDVMFLSNIDMIQRLRNRETTEYVNTVVAWNKLYRRKVVENLRYPEGKLHEDEYVVGEILTRVSKVALIDMPLYYYFQRENSIMSDEKTAGNLSIDLLKAYQHRVETFRTCQLKIESEYAWRNGALTIIEQYFKEEKHGENNENSAMLQMYKEWFNTEKTNIPLKWRCKYMLFIISPKLFRKIFGLRDV